MKICKVLITFILLTLNVTSTKNILAQNWEGLRSLNSSCQDVKLKLGVAKCKVPVSEFTFPEFKIRIFFSESGNPWRIPSGRITHAYISFRQLPLLKDYKDNLSNYEKTPVSDLPDSGLTLYINDKRGIRLSVLEDKWIQGIVLYPPKPQKIQKKR